MFNSHKYFCLFFCLAYRLGINARTLLALLENSLGFLIANFLKSNPITKVSRLLKRDERKECLLEGYNVCIVV